MPHKSAEPTDRDVVRRVLAGDINAFEVLVARYQAYVFSIVGRHVPTQNVEDVAHDVFVRAYRSLPKYQQKSGVSQWLRGIAVRTCADFWRERYRRREVPMSRLGGNQREWLENMLAHLEGYSVKEAAGLLGCSAANVKIRAFRARKKIQKLLADEEISR